MQSKYPTITFSCVSLHVILCWHENDRYLCLLELWLLCGPGNDATYVRCVQHHHFQSRIALMVDSSSELTACNLDAQDVANAYAMGLLREDVTIALDPSDRRHFAVAYDKGRNLAVHDFESQKAVQRLCRDFAVKGGFHIKVGCNSFNRSKQEGNAKYVCKQAKGQQSVQSAQQSGGSDVQCPFFVNAYGLNGLWKITKARFDHNHLKHVGFTRPTPNESNLSRDDGNLRNRDIPFDRLRSWVEQEMVPSYAQEAEKMTGKAIVEFIQRKGHSITRQTASKIKLSVLERQKGDMVKSYRLLRPYLERVSVSNPGCTFAIRFANEDGSTLAKLL